MSLYIYMHIKIKQSKNKRVINHGERIVYYSYLLGNLLFINSFIMFIKDDKVKFCSLYSIFSL